VATAYNGAADLDVCSFMLSKRVEKDKQLSDKHHRLDEESRHKVHLSLDPMISTLLSASSATELSEMIRCSFDKLDCDRSGALSYAELRDGLKKMRYTPPIKLTEDEWDTITGQRTLCTREGEVNLECWEAILRTQMVSYCQRKLAVSVPDVMRDDVHKGMEMFAIKLILESCKGVGMVPPVPSSPHKGSLRASSPIIPGHSRRNSSPPFAQGAAPPTHLEADMHDTKLAQGAASPQHVGAINGSPDAREAGCDSPADSSAHGGLAGAAPPWPPPCVNPGDVAGAGIGSERGVDEPLATPASAPEVRVLSAIEASEMRIISAIRALEARCEALEQSSAGGPDARQASAGESSAGLSNENPALCAQLSRMQDHLTSSLQGMQAELGSALQAQFRSIHAELASVKKTIVATHEHVIQPHQLLADQLATLPLPPSRVMGESTIPEAREGTGGGRGPSPPRRLSSGNSDFTGSRYSGSGHFSMDTGSGDSILTPFISHSSQLPSESWRSPRQRGAASRSRSPRSQQFSPRRSHSTPTFPKRSAWYGGDAAARDVQQHRGELVNELANASHVPRARHTDLKLYRRQGAAAPPGLASMVGRSSGAADVVAVSRGSHAASVPLLDRGAELPSHRAGRRVSTTDFTGSTPKTYHHIGGGEILPAGPSSAAAGPQLAKAANVAVGSPGKEREAGSRVLEGGASSLRLASLRAAVRASDAISQATSPRPQSDVGRSSSLVFAG